MFIEWTSWHLVYTYYRCRQLARVQSMGTLSRNPAKVRNYYLPPPAHHHWHSVIALKCSFGSYAPIQRQQYGSAPTHPARQVGRPVDTLCYRATCHSVLSTSVSVCRVSNALHRRIINAEFSLQRASHNSRVNHQGQSWSQICEFWESFITRCD